MFRRFLTLVPLLLILGCDDDSVGPADGLYPSYFLTSIDGDPLPVPFLDDGSVLVAGGLGFGSNRPRADGTPGTVDYRMTIRRPDQSIDQSTTQLHYRIEDDVLIINLCPPLALCITSMELIGPVDRTELVLTRHVGGHAGSVERYFASLPD